MPASAKRLGRWSVGLPVSCSAAFVMFWMTADANDWLGRKGSDLAALTFGLLLLATALSVIAALVLSIMAWRATRREGRRAWPRLIPGVLAAVLIGGLVVLVVWAFFASMGRFR